MIQQSSFPVEPWAIRETELDLERLAQAESLFALSNGHLGMRGNLDEGEPYGIPGTYLGGFWELRPLPSAESGYGDPESGQEVVNVTNGKILRLLVDDEPFDVRYGNLGSHERVLDMREGVLRRTTEWTSPSHHSVRVSSCRLVSFAQRAIAAILYEVEATDGQSVRVVVQSELIANEELPRDEGDPRAGALLEAPLEQVSDTSKETSAMLVHRTRGSGLAIAAGMRHEIGGVEFDVVSETFGDIARVNISALLEPGAKLRIVKYLAYGWSANRSATALTDQVSAALSQALATGWDGLLKSQREFLDDFWRRADVKLEGDAELQQATRFGLFHVLQSGARTEQRAIAAKGLTGPGYDGHAFWDTEAFVLPVLTYTMPQAAADALRWRHSTLDLARERAALLGLAGAAFPWRTIAGQECSGYWPASTAAFHISADVAAAVLRYQQITGDEDFAAKVGTELLVETARMWHSLGHRDTHGGFRIDGVTGPDEYSAVADNNLYTNLMARKNLAAAAAAAAARPEIAQRLGVTMDEVALWRDDADSIVMAFDEERGVHQQAERFTEHQVWDFEAMTEDQYPLLLHFPYFELYRKQVVKQADLVLAMHLCGDAFTPAQKLANFDYYEPLTVRDSSLSACTQAVMAAEVDHLDLAYAYYREAALMDLDDLEHNVRDGLHIASLAGAWTAAVAGFGGMRDYGGKLSFRPKLPEQLTGLSFRLHVRGANLAVAIEPTQATYTTEGKGTLHLTHYDEPIKLTSSKAVTLEIPKPQRRTAPKQPRWREPKLRERGED